MSLYEKRLEFTPFCINKECFFLVDTLFDAKSSLNRLVTFGDQKRKLQVHLLLKLKEPSLYTTYAKMVPEICTNEYAASKLLMLLKKDLSDSDGLEGYLLSIIDIEEAKVHIASQGAFHPYTLDGTKPTVVEAESFGLYTNRSLLYGSEKLVGALQGHSFKGSGYEFYRYLPKEVLADESFCFFNFLHLDVRYRIAYAKFYTSLKDIEHALEWYEAYLQKHLSNVTRQQKISVVFHELIMNAYEHGNLAIDYQQKHRLIEEDHYYDYLIEQERNCQKKIYVSLYRLPIGEHPYLITHIRDEGEGFMRQILQTIAMHSSGFNGRGIRLSRKYTDALYYNSKGNEVIFFVRL